MSIPPARRALAAAFALLCGATALVQAARRPPSQEPRDAVLVPFLVEEARVLGVVDVQVLVANPGPDGSELVLERLRVRSEGATLVDLPLADVLPGDPRYAQASALVERMPHGHGAEERWFAPADAPALEGDAAVAAWSEVQALLDAMRADFAAGRAEPFVHVGFALALDQVFLPEDPAGARRVVELVLDYRDAAGAPATLAVERELVRLAPPLGTPASLALGGYTVHAGDLHVHSCHGEAVGACAPSGNCAAETLETSGSFSYAQLKTQYQALGLDWFTATDHSYCIDSDAEYDVVVAECAALTDGAFLAVPDIELSSDEVGAQVGSDLGDTVCLGTTEANHMGAHGIESRKPGGTQGFLGFCDGFFGGDALAAFTSNAAAIRAEGGFPIANHPTAGSYAWNSFAATQGIEANALHGVEIWNGATQSGQGGHVGRWVDWLLGGRILYAYSGSDTHDAAFAFGANHALVQGPFTVASLEAALKAGRVYVSNEHVLALEVDHAGATLAMGALQALAPGTPAGPLVLRAHYDFGADQAQVTFFRGRVGDAAETVVFQSGPLTGAGVLAVPATLDPTGRTWYRAYSESGAKTAYTNPVFFLPGSCAFTAYGTGLGGANVGTLASASAPTIGSVAVLAASFPGGLAGPVYYGASAAAIPGGVPLFGGHLLIGVPTLLVAPGALAGGQGSFVFPIPFEPSLAGAQVHWQAIALDAAQPFGLAFTNGLSLTVCDLLQ
jgi:hypothetical protein